MIRSQARLRAGQIEKLTKICFVGVLLSAPLSWSQSAANVETENKFHQIFKKYNEQPTSIDVWQRETAKGSSHHYQVQKKDTLWDISQALFGDPHFWPKIWALNGSGMLNPHEINAGQQIQFTEGTFGEPPALAVTEALSADNVAKPGDSEASVAAGSVPGPDSAPADKATVYPNGQVNSGELPEPRVGGAKYADLPTSLPAWEPVTRMADFKMLVKPIQRPQPVYDQILPFYITESSPEAVGLIAETEQGMKAASDRQQVYVKFNEPPAHTRYLVVEEKGQVEDPWMSKKGNSIQILGELEIIELANAAKNIYRARSTQMLSHFMVGSKVIAGDIAVVSPTFESEASPVHAKIIGGAFDVKRNLFGPQEIVYINVGASGGVGVGQSFAVYKNQKMRNQDTDIELNPPVIGHVKVVKVTDQFATALVSDVIDEIRVGDDLNSPSTPSKSE